MLKTLLWLYAILTILLMAENTWSQTTSQQQNQDSEEKPIEEVAVTGSRIVRSILDSPSPVLVFEGSDLSDIGITTLGEFSRYLPQNADTLSDSASSGSDFRGSSGFNLRGIGLDGTLTLLNGRRVAPFGASGDQLPFVDINAIPVAAIDRIEVLMDGASAIYGSEAVAGVVNIITRKSFEKPTLEVGYLSTTRGDGSETDASLVGGWSSESTRLAGTLNWFDRDRIWSRDRDWSSDLDLSDAGGFNSRSSFSSPPTAILLDSQVFRADPACPESGTVNSIVRFPTSGGRIREDCRFNWPWFTTLQQPSTRWAATGLLEHDFSDDVSLFLDVIYSRNKTNSVLAPTPIQNFFVAESHPDNPFGEDVLIRYRLLAGGDRGFETTATSWRALAGLKGSWSDWNWETAVMSSESESLASRVNGVLGDEFQTALLGFGGSNQDQYFNPFGLNPENSQDVLDQFLVSGSRRGFTNKENTFDAQVTGKFGQLPGGQVGAAFGFQYRTQDLSGFADEREVSGELLGTNAIFPIDADRKINSFFAEFFLPLTETIEVQAAVRTDDYNDFGSTTNPKIGVGWRPLDSLLLRATWGTSFRPPTFRELYEPPFHYETFVNDPLRCPVTMDFDDCFGREVPVTIQGNDQLSPDDGEHSLLGFAWESPGEHGWSLSVDFWRLEHKNRITYSGDPGFGGIFDLFMENLQPEDNVFVGRAAATAEDIALGIPGVITDVLSTYVNADVLTVSGLDLNVSYQWHTLQSGDFKVAVSYTYLDRYEAEISLKDANFSEDLAGKYGEFSALPKNRGNMQFNWKKDNHGIFTALRYVGGYESPFPLGVNGIPTDTIVNIDDYFQFDLQYRYTFQQLRQASLRLGCTNCFDENPPVYNYATVAEPFHESRGAMVYLRWIQPF